MYMWLFNVCEQSRRRFKKKTQIMDAFCTPSLVKCLDNGHNRKLCFGHGAVHALI